MLQQVVSERSPAGQRCMRREGPWCAHRPATRNPEGACPRPSQLVVPEMARLLVVSWKRLGLFCPWEASVQQAAQIRPFGLHAQACA